MKLHKITAAALSALLGLFGFSSCNNEECMYGVPTADYQVKGRVTDQKGNPIPGIKVDLALTSYGEMNKTLFSDEEGEFSTEFNGSIMGSVIFTDVDGEENGGEFVSRTTELNLYPRKQLKKGKDWYGGVFEVTIDQRLDKVAK